MIRSLTYIMEPLHIKRALVFIFIAVCYCFPVFCKDNCVLIYTKNAAPTLIPFESVEDISFSGDKMSIGTYNFTLQDVEKYEFADASSVISIKDDGCSLQIKFDPKGIVYFDETIKIGPITVSDISGIPCRIKTAPGIVDFSHCSPGIYIVSIGSESIKVIKQ